MHLCWCFETPRLDPANVRPLCGSALPSTSRKFRRRVVRQWFSGVARAAGFFVALLFFGCLASSRRVPFARGDLQAGTAHAHLDLVEPAVARMRRRIVADDVVAAVAVDDPLERRRHRVGGSRPRSRRFLRRAIAGCPATRASRPAVLSARWTVSRCSSACPRAEAVDSTRDAAISMNWCPCPSGRADRG